MIDIVRLSVKKFFGDCLNKVFALTSASYFFLASLMN